MKQFVPISCGCLFSIAFLSLLAVGKISRGQEVSEESLKSLIKSMAIAQQDFDAAKLDTILSEDYLEVSPAGELDHREKVLGFYKPETKPPADKFSATVEADEFTIRDFGEFAIVVAKLEYTIKSDGIDLPPRKIRATFACRMVGDEWKVVSAQYTGIRPTQAASPSAAGS